MNDKSHTYLDSGKGTVTSIDLSVCHPSLSLDFYWSVCENQHSSDHFPIIIESIQTSTEYHNPKWKLNEADWDLFHSLCDQTLPSLSLSESDNPIADFTFSLMDISEKCMSKTSTNPKKSSPWSNDDCKEAITQKNKLCLRSASFQRKKI